MDLSEVSFNLCAVNWQSVKLLEGAHLDADRVYLEELIRCSLYYTGRSGVVDLGESDLIPGSTSAQYTGVRLTRCKAVTPRGYLICWDSENQPGEGVTGSADSTRSGQTEPIYLCIEAEREAAYAYPPQEIRNQCSFVRPRLSLSTTTGGGELDAVKIGQFRRNDANHLELDMEFIPNCMRLDSHWLLKRRIEAIRLAAKYCMDALVKQLQGGQFHLEPLAIPLGTASTLVDWSVSPLTYLERMIAVMRANFALQFLIPDTAIKARVYASLDLALRTIEPSIAASQLDWAQALKLIEDSFKSLAGAFSGAVEARRPSILDQAIRGNTGG